MKPDPRSASDRLSAQLPTQVLDTSNALQERVLRAIASHWKGELRVNPASTTLGRRLTVHSQGGCPMGDDETGVTDKWGEVHKCPGLYVMDAAAFPTSAGVNPSATITAVAEFKIEHFIREHSDNKEWSSPDKQAAGPWVDRHGREDIDPLNHRDFKKTDPVQFPPLGMTFKERMTGFYNVPRDKAIIDLLADPPVDVIPFTRAEDKGINAGHAIAIDLAVQTADLARVVCQEPTVQPPPMSVSGTIALSSDLGHTTSTYPLDAGSNLQMFLRPANQKPPTRLFRYDLRFKENGADAELIGYKVLRNTPGLDVWSDSSTLYFEIRHPAKPKHEIRRGVLRISLEEFLQREIQSIRITGTTDVARKSWALAAFYRYFASEIAEVYITRGEAIRQVLASLLTGIHV
jgi:cholesterol oxidase